jgi:hypothetical protein
MSSSRFEFNEDMNEVSGFGGFYERCCRVGVCAGAEWFAAHPKARPVFDGLPDVLGLLVPANDEARALERAIEATLVTRDDGTKAPLGEEMTALQFYAIVNHTMYIANHGWNRYVDFMTSPMNVYREDGTRIKRAP